MPTGGQAAVPFADLTDAQFIEAMAAEMARREAFRAVELQVEALMLMSASLHSLTASADQAFVAARNAIVDQVPGLEESIRGATRQAAIEKAAHADILERPMLDAGEVAVVLRREGSSRSAAQRLRADSSVVALLVAGKYQHPAFQFDVGRACVRPHVAEANKLLDVAGDPWGVASWWLSPHGRLPEGASPADLAVSEDPQDNARVLVLARTLLDD